MASGSPLQPKAPSKPLPKAPKLDVPKGRPRFFIPDAKFATVLVGSKQARFVVHECLLTYHSEFFRAALTGRFKEADEKVVRLPDDNPELFEVVIHTLYHDRFPDTHKGDAEELVKIFKGVSIDLYVSDPLCVLIRLYLFGDKYIMPKVARLAMDTIKEKKLEYSHASILSVCRVAKEVDADATFGRFLAKVFVSMLSKYSWKALFDLVSMAEMPPPTSFLQECVLLLAAESVRPNNNDFDCCDYHKHKDEAERKACKASRGIKDAKDKIPLDREAVPKIAPSGSRHHSGPRPASSDASGIIKFGRLF